MGEADVSIRSGWFYHDNQEPKSCLLYTSKSVATVRRLVKTIKDVDATRYVTMGADKFRFGDGSGGHEKVAAELDAVGFNYSEANYESLRAKHPNWLIYGSETDVYKRQALYGSNRSRV